MNNYLIYALGFLSQILFFARTVTQWFKSEHEGEVISPIIFWQISLVASIMMLLYGILRNDFAIVLGQFIVYSIYIRNLQLKNAWKTMHPLSRIFIILLPLACVGWLIFGGQYNFKSILKNQDVPLLLMIWGSVGQVVFTLRFIYQWIYSESRNDSILPLGFWVISTIGSMMIFTYSIFRLDPVLFVAHSLSLFIYIRNILLHYGKGGLFAGTIEIPLLKKIFQRIADRIK